MEPVLIGLSGVKRSGKSTTANFIAKYASRLSPGLSVVQRGFADRGKLAFARQFFPKITQEEAILWCDNWKNDSTSGFTDFGDRGYIEKMPKPGPLDGAKIVFRDALAQFCTDGGRDIYGEDHWVDQLLPNTQVIHPVEETPWYPRWHEEFRHREYGIALPFRHLEAMPEIVPVGVADICVITDERFENECQRIHELGGYNVKIKRKDAEDAVIEEARRRGKEVHRSELGISDDKFDVIIDNSDNDMTLAYERTCNAMDDILSGAIRNRKKSEAYIYAD